MEKIKCLNCGHVFEEKREWKKLKVTLNNPGEEMTKMKTKLLSDKEKEWFENKGRAEMRKEILEMIDEWLKERTYQNKKELPALTKFMPFEWEELKSKIMEKK